MRKLSASSVTRNHPETTVLAFSLGRMATNLKRLLEIVTNVQRATTSDSSGGPEAI